MTIAQTFLPELDQEMANTRRVLERVPEDQFGWKPHEKSMTLGALASHLAQLAGMATRVFAGDSIDVAPPGGPPPAPTQLTSRQAILDTFDANVKTSREALAQAEDSSMAQTWTLLRGGQTMFSLPRLAVVRTAFLNHIIHHRGQLTVYLRLAGALVPAIYGPSADEPRM